MAIHSDSRTLTQTSSYKAISNPDFIQFDQTMKFSVMCDTLDAFQLHLYVCCCHDGCTTFQVRLLAHALTNYCWASYVEMFQIQVTSVVFASQD